MDRYWDLDGGPGDRHRVMIDAKNLIYGHENVRPNDGIVKALLEGATQFRHYDVQERGGDTQNG